MQAPRCSDGKRHYWPNKVVCDKCGMKREDFEAERKLLRREEKARRKRDEQRP